MPRSPRRPAPERPPSPELAQPVARKSDQPCRPACKQRSAESQASPRSADVQPQHGTRAQPRVPRSLVRLPSGRGPARWCSDRECDAADEWTGQVGHQARPTFGKEQRSELAGGVEAAAAVARLAHSEPRLPATCTWRSHRASRDAIVMRADIRVASRFLGYEHTDHTGTPRRLSELQGEEPMIVVLAPRPTRPRTRSSTRAWSSSARR